MQDELLSLRKELQNRPGCHPHYYLNIKTNIRYAMGKERKGQRVLNDL